MQRMPFYGAYKSLSHYPDYWYWKLRRRPVRSPHLLKQRTVVDIAEKFALRTLVETGTYYGEIVAKRSKAISIASIRSSTIPRSRSGPRAASSATRASESSKAIAPSSSRSF